MHADDKNNKITLYGSVVTRRRTYEANDVLASVGGIEGGARAPAEVDVTVHSQVSTEGSPRAAFSTLTSGNLTGSPHIVTTKPRPFPLTERHQ